MSWWQSDGYAHAPPTAESYLQINTYTLHALTWAVHMVILISHHLEWEIQFDFIWSTVSTFEKGTDLIQDRSHAPVASRCGRNMEHTVYVAAICCIPAPTGGLCRSKTLITMTDTLYTTKQKKLNSIPVKSLKVIGIMCMDLVTDPPL